jgi:lysophospholipase L1-like esterase
MKKLNLVILAIFITILGTSLVNSFHASKKASNIEPEEKIKYVEVKKEKVLFLGDSITDLYNLKLYYDNKDKVFINSGRSGYKTTDLLKNFRNMLGQFDPDTVVILIGTNDLSAGTPNDKIVSNIKKIVNEITSIEPNKKIYIQSIYPVNRSKRPKGEKRDNKNIKYINEELKKFCLENNITFIDLYDSLTDRDGDLKSSYSEDGLHLTDAGYNVVTNILKATLKED